MREHRNVARGEVQVLGGLAVRRRLSAAHFPYLGPHGYAILTGQHETMVQEVLLRPGNERHPPGAGGAERRERFLRQALAEMPVVRIADQQRPPEAVIAEHRRQRQPAALAGLSQEQRNHIRKILGKTLRELLACRSKLEET